MNIAVSILSLAFFVRVIYKAFYLLWLFQVKEYRFDRLIAHFRETKEGRRFFVSKREFALWILFILPFFYRFSFIAYPYVLLVIIIFTLETYDLVNSLRKKQFRKPIFTAKASMLTAFTLIAIIILVLPSISPIPLVFIDRFLILIISLLVVFLSIPEGVVKNIIMFLATRKMNGMKNLTIIGVAGSYGKSSTKELIADFLSTKYNVLKTPGSVNTELGIALFVLRKLKREHEIFVVEIGAYKRGEIAAVAKMVKPTIGVLTGINEQHLSLFGSLENTKKAKFELIESLPSDGKAFFNGDDSTTLEMSKLSKLKNTFVYSAKNLKLSTNSNSSPFLANIAAALLIAQKLGVDKTELSAKVVNARKSLGLKTQKSGELTILDDSFNTNPKGFSAALAVLSQQKGRKILVTPGIIELGTESKRIHEELGEKIGTICDMVVLTNDNFEEPIREGLMKAKFNMENFLIPKRNKLVTVINSQIHEKASVLLEGRIPMEVKRLL